MLNGFGKLYGLVFDTLRFLISRPGGLRGAIKSAEASFEASCVSLGLVPQDTLMENLEGSFYLKELT